MKISTVDFYPLIVLYLSFFLSTVFVDCNKIFNNILRLNLNTQLKNIMC